MRIRFWGTRGSLPVSLTAAAVRRKLVTALRGASCRTFASDGEIEAYLDGLGLAVAGTFGGHSPCVEIETGGPDYVLCDLGSVMRPFGQAAIARHGPASPQTYHVFVSFYPPQDLTPLALTEIMYNPPDLGAISGSDLEFIELKNRGSNILDLSGLTFSSGITFTFTNGTRLDPGQFFVLVRNPAAFATK